MGRTSSFLTNYIVILPNYLVILNAVKNLGVAELLYARHSRWILRFSQNDNKEN